MYGTNRLGSIPIEIDASITAERLNRIEQGLLQYDQQTSGHIYKYLKPKMSNGIYGTR